MCERVLRRVRIYTVMCRSHASANRVIQYFSFSEDLQGVPKIIAKYISLSFSFLVAELLEHTLYDFQNSVTLTEDKSVAPPWHQRSAAGLERWRNWRVDDVVNTKVANKLNLKSY